MSVSIDQIAEHVLRHFDGVVDDFNWGERALFYNPRRLLPKGIYFLTFKERDGANDRASRIGPGEFRLNVGIPRQTFVAWFGRVPPRPPAGGVVEGGHDFTLRDRVTPHPVYGWMCWIAVKNPSRETFESLRPVLAQSYAAARARFARRMASVKGDRA